MTISEMRWEIRKAKRRLRVIDQFKSPIEYYNLVRVILLVQEDLIRALLKERKAPRVHKVQRRAA